MNPAQQKLAEKIGRLLAQSPLDDVLKEKIMSNLDAMPEGVAFQLLDLLQAENKQLQSLASELELLVAKQDYGWKKLEDDQNLLADQLVDKYIAKTEDEIKIVQLKSNLPGTIDN